MKPQHISTNYNPELKSGYPNLESLAALKGFTDSYYGDKIQRFNTHYCIYWNTDENGNKFYICEPRRS